MEHDNVIDERDLHLMKVSFPIVLTELGIVIVDRLIQFEKAESSILVMELGRQTDVKAVQLAKASLSIVDTEASMVTLCTSIGTTMSFLPS